VTIPWLFASPAASPAACTTRARASAGRLSARLQRNEPTENISRPSRKTFFCPRISPSLPNGRVSTESVIRKTPAIHAADSPDTPNDDAILGRAILTALVSNDARNEKAAAAARTLRLVFRLPFSPGSTRSFLPPGIILNRKAGFIHRPAQQSPLLFP